MAAVSAQEREVSGPDAGGRVRSGHRASGPFPSLSDRPTPSPRALRTLKPEQEERLSAKPGNAPAAAPDGDWQTSRSNGCARIDEAGCAAGTAERRFAVDPPGLLVQPVEEVEECKRIAQLFGLAPSTFAWHLAGSSNELLADKSLPLGKRLLDALQRSDDLVILLFSAIHMGPAALHELSVLAYATSPQEPKVNAEYQDDR